MKSLFFKVTREGGLVGETSLTLLRVFAGLAIAFGHGLGKLPPSEILIAGAGAMGFPMPFLFAWCAALSEFLGGIFLALGFLTRPSAFFIGCTVAVAGFLRHSADPFKVKELAFVYLAIMVVFVVRGASSFSVDRFIK
jgi:putative oxidoreductase